MQNQPPQEKELNRNMQRVYYLQQAIPMLGSEMSATEKTLIRGSCSAVAKALLNALSPQPQ